MLWTTCTVTGREENSTRVFTRVTACSNSLSLSLLLAPLPSSQHITMATTTASGFSTSSAHRVVKLIIFM